MKKLIILAAFIILAALPAKAQDIITRKDGTKIEAKIVSVKEEIVDYKRSNYVDGPTFSISVYDVDTITYANGDVQKFEDLKAKAVMEKGITLGMKYKDYKDLYDTDDYVHDYREPYSPAVAGVTSFFFPGVGQMINNQFVKGFGMLAAWLGFVIAGYNVGDKYQNNGKTYVRATTGSYALWAGALAVDVWSIVDAINVAKIKDLYWRDCEHITSVPCNIRFAPDFEFAQTYQSVQPVAGMKLAISF